MEGDQIQPERSRDRRVLRGGSWGNFDNLLRVAYRGSGNPSNTYNYIGFRCARSP